MEWSVWAWKLDVWYKKQFNEKKKVSWENECYMNPKNYFISLLQIRAYKKKLQWLSIKKKNCWRLEQQWKKHK